MSNIFVRSLSALITRRHFTVSSIALSSTGRELKLPSWSVIKPFGSIKVDLTEAYSEGWNTSVDTFSQLLQTHVTDWRLKGHSAVWLHIPIPLSSLISVAASEHDFTLHHGNKEEVVMSKWLQSQRQNRLPHYASHQVGVCGVVTREDTDEVLVTQDKYKPPVWKFPGGLSEFAEDITDAVVREVREETGIHTDFQSVLAFRQQHRLRQYFNVSDLYFVCRLKPLTFDISPCQDEVIKCKWMKVRELASSQEATPLTHRTAELLLESKVKGYDFIDIRKREIEMNFPDYTVSKYYHLYTR